MDGWMDGPDGPVSGENGGKKDIVAKMAGRDV